MKIIVDAKGPHACGKTFALELILAVLKQHFQVTDDLRFSEFSQTDGWSEVLSVSIAGAAPEPVSEHVTEVDIGTSDETR